MSRQVFQDKIFPRHIADLMNLMHMMVFNGTDGEENWSTYLSPRQKEYVALGLAQYYQCSHCIDYHTRSLIHLDKTHKDTLSKNIRAMILFLRIDTRTITTSEKEHWIESWHRFAKNISHETSDLMIPHLIGLAIGIARDDDFLIQFCGSEVNGKLSSQAIEFNAAIGELESLVIYMKAAVSKNRVVDKLEQLLEATNNTD